MRREKATLVLSSAGATLLDWSKTDAQDSRVIETWNLNLLKESLHLALDHIDVEIVRVIFDQSIDAEEWLEFLSSMPIQMRGDVLFIARREKAFMSAVGRSDERVIYQLSQNDLEFYLGVAGFTVENGSGFRFPDEEPRLALAV